MRRKKDGKDGVFIFLPFLTTPTDLPESVHVNQNFNSGHGVLVNVGWLSIDEYKKNGLRNFKLPESEDFDIVNNELGNLGFGITYSEEFGLKNGFGLC